MRQDKKQRDRPAIAMVLCFCLMALVCVFAVKSNIDKVSDNMKGYETSEVLKEKAVDDIENAAEKTEASTKIIDSRDESGGSSENNDKKNMSDAENTAPEAAAKYILPLEGEIIMEYSTDMPIYWKTLDQYMTHSGVDIAADMGTPVQACAGGTVTKIEENDKMGVTVEINHGNDVITVYSNLAADGLIELGEIVRQGTVIGKVGQSSMFEFEDPPHLHFEMRMGDTSVNPGDYITTLT